MTVEQALKNLEDATASISCNRQVQLILLESIKILRDFIAKDIKKED